MKKIKLRKKSLKKIIQISKEFAVDSGLLRNKKIINLIKKIESFKTNPDKTTLPHKISGLNHPQFWGQRNVKYKSKS